MATTKRKALVYARVARGTSQHSDPEIMRQINSCKEYVHSNGWALSGEYRDIGSGLPPIPEQLTILLKEFEKDPSQTVIVCKDSSRLSRDVETFFSLLERVKALGGEIFFYEGKSYPDDNMAEIIHKAHENRREE